MFPTRQFAASAATASLLIAGAFFGFLCSVVDARAEGSPSICENAAEIAVLPSPIAPWRGAPLRVLFVVEKPHDPQDHTRHAAFAQGLQELGRTIGRNLRIDYRWGAASPDNTRKYAAELAALAPDVILASGFVALAAVQQTSPTIPVVFVNVIDPVSGSFVESLARPGGNATGFLLFEYTTTGKLVELLKQIAPRVTRAAILGDMRTASGSGQLGARSASQCLPQC